MIKKVSAIDSFNRNSTRTEMLIVAMEKIKAYNRIYQDKAMEVDIQYGYVVRDSQDKELTMIERSCAEHAIISLATTFKVYYKELLQELLYRYSLVFMNVESRYREKIKDLVTRDEYFDYEYIANYLGLKNRKDFFEFFKKYGLVLLTGKEEKIIGHIYTLRNCYVHNAGKIDKKTRERLREYPSPTGEGYLATEAKRLRTKFKRLIIKANERIMNECERMNSLIVR